MELERQLTVEHEKFLEMGRARDAHDKMRALWENAAYKEQKRENMFEATVSIEELKRQFEENYKEWTQQNRLLQMENAELRERLKILENAVASGLNANSLNSNNVAVLRAALDPEGEMPQFRTNLSDFKRS